MCVCELSITPYRLTRLFQWRLSRPPGSRHREYSCRKVGGPTPHLRRKRMSGHHRCLQPEWHHAASFWDLLHTRNPEDQRVVMATNVPGPTTSRHRSREHQVGCYGIRKDTSVPQRYRLVFYFLCCNILCFNLYVRQYLPWWKSKIDVTKSICCNRHHQHQQHPVYWIKLTNLSQILRFRFSHTGSGTLFFFLSADNNTR